MIGALIRFSIRFPGIVLSLAALLLVYGGYVLQGIRLDVFPEFAPNMVVIQTEAPGLGSELVETQVTQRIEAQVAGVAGLDMLRSQSIPGLSVVTVQFQEGTSLLRNRQTVSERLTALGSQLPAGVAAPRITPLTSSTSTTLGIGVTSKTRTPIELRTLVDATIRPHLISAPGVADINVFGGDLRQWQVQLDPARMAALGVTVNDVTAALRATAQVRGAGMIENSNQRILIGIESQPLQPESVARLPLPLPGRAGAAASAPGSAPGPASATTSALTIGDVATVAIGAAPAISGAVIDGEPGILLLAQAQLGSSLPKVTAGLERAVEQLRPALARQDVQLNPAMFRPANFIETATDNVRGDVLIGSVLVLAVLLLFLFNLRTALISAAAIPLSLLAAILVLHFLGYGLNLMAIAGLAIALGEVVDDAIIDMENIFRRLREHRADPARATTVEQVVFDASIEVRASVILATFVVALVFYPLLTMSGVAGRLFFPLGLAYILALFASLLVAMTVTPALCLLLLARWPRPVPTRDPPLVRWLVPRYRALLLRIQAWPRTLMTLVALLIAGALALSATFSGEFLPPLKEGHFIVHFTATPGTSRDEAVRIGQRVAQQIRAIEGVVSTAQWVGRAPGGPDTAGIHYSEMHVELGRKSAQQQEAILSRIRAVLTDEQQGIGGLAFGVNTFLAERIGETVSGFVTPIAVNIHGPSLERLDRDAARIAAAIAKLPGALDVQVQAPPGTPQLTIRLLPGRLRSHGVLAAQVFEAVATAYGGAQVGTIYESGLPSALTVVLAASERRQPSRVGALTIRADDGRLVPLSALATISIEDGRYSVLRLNGKRVQTVTANLRGRDLDAFERQVQALLAQPAMLSEGNYALLAGLSQARKQAQRDLAVHGLVTLVGIGALLFVALGSMRHVAITFLNLPFALVGGIFAVMLGGNWVSVGSMVGFVTLFGITLRNSIMLISHCRHLVEVDGRRWNRETAVLAACERLPSILMTAIVTALALLPLALNTGEPGREIEGPMAAVIVGGLISSTVLNLLVLPVVLLYFGRFGPQQPRGGDDYPTLDTPSP